MTDMRIDKLSIIIPVLDDADALRLALQSLRSLRAKGHEVIVVDGGSSDDSRRVAEADADKVLTASPSRAGQMNAGARAASGTALLFLHADTALPPDADLFVFESTRRGGWGRFNVRLSGRQPVFRLIEQLMNWRSCLTGIATGDQAIFVRRDLFEQIGGFPNIPLMEDIALSRRLKLHSRPHCVSAAVVASSRRWETHGILRTILLMWSLRLAYYLGADPVHLVRYYRFG